MKATKFKNDNTGYFDGLPESTQQTARDVLEDVFRHRAPETWDGGTIEEIECRSRDMWRVEKVERSGQ